MIDNTGRWTLVTGASRGVGYLAAKYMASMGCNLVLHSRDKEHTKDILGEVLKLGIRARTVEANLDNPASVERMLEEIDSWHIDIDIVLNNAGIMTAYRKDFCNTPASDFETSFRANLISPMLICYHFLPKMKEKGFGRIVNTTSGIMNTPELAGYSGSKAALDKCTYDLGTRYEGTGVMINLVDPGWLRTDMGGHDAPNPVESALPGVVLGAFLDDGRNGRVIRALEFSGMDLGQAVEKFQNKGK